MMISGNSDPLNIINNVLTKDLQKYIKIEFTFREINRLPLERFANYVQIYISPSGSKDNIPYMKNLYEKRISLPNLIVACYSAYHPRDEAILDINYPDENFIIKYTDFGVQSTYGYSQDGKPLLNLIILIKQPIASKIIKKEKIEFKNKNNEIESRELYLPNKYNAVSLILNNIIGEYNLINHIGYIELLPEDDPLASNSNFSELLEIREELNIILKHYNYKKCNYCEHHELQTALFRCSRCKKIYYCNKICQLSDWINHKFICQ